MREHRVGSSCAVVIAFILATLCMMPSGAAARGKVDFLFYANPYVSGDSIQASGYLSQWGAGTARLRADRIDLEERVVTDGNVSWALRDTQYLDQTPGVRTKVDLSYVPAADLGAVTLRVRVIRGKSKVASTGVRRYGLKDLYAESVNGNCAIQASGQAVCWDFGFRGNPGNEYLSQTKTALPISSLAHITDIQGFCAVRVSGQPVCWGDNEDQIVGDGTDHYRPFPAKVYGLSEVKQVTTSYYNGCALQIVGRVYCWGYSYLGALGNGKDDNTLYRKPTRVKGLMNATMIETSSSSTCAVTADAKATCWGDNRLAYGFKDIRFVPEEVPGLSNVVEVGTEGPTECALIATGEVYCWGRNDEGQLGDGRKITKKPFGRAKPMPVQGLDDATAISVNEWGGCALRDTGEVSCWGSLNFAEIGPGPFPGNGLLTTVPGLTDAKSITTDGTPCAIRQSGQVVCWGDLTGVGFDGWGYISPAIPSVPTPVRTG